MPRYSYQARDGLGSQTTGTIEAPTEHEAARLLRDDNLTVTSISIATRISSGDNNKKHTFQRGMGWPLVEESEC